MQQDVYSKFNTRGFVWIPFVIVVAVVIVGFGLGFVITHKGPAAPTQMSSTGGVSTAPTPTASTISVLSTPTQMPSATPEPTTISTMDATSVLISGDIKWHERRLLSDQHIWTYPNSEGSMSTTASYWSVGTFLKGSYKGGDIIVVGTPCDGPCSGDNLHTFLRWEGRFTLLQKYSDGIYPEDGFIRDRFIIDEKTVIADIEFPDLLTQPGTRITLKKDKYARDWFDPAGLVVAFTHPQYGTAYTDAPPHKTKGSFADRREGFVFRGPDGLKRVYELVPDIIAEDIPNVAWNAGSTNAQAYSYTDIGGCGSINYASVIDPSFIDPKKDLKVAGTTSKGDQVYELVDSEHDLLKDIYANEYQVYGQGKEKISYEAFLSRHPVFFWRDPLGRLIKFQNVEFLPQGECGKPVIYLYPDRNTRVRVHIEPKGGLLYAEPTYDDSTGWTVDAKPSGTLTDLATGQSYPYLFWEGRGGIYTEPHEGFVVGRGNINSFLGDALGQLGLNERERDDFIAYWEPRMRSAPYYFISFLGRREMDALAPLTVVPEPDTVIRVLMDYKPLEKPMAVEPQALHTIPRIGFTVIEWGGVQR